VSLSSAIIAARSGLQASSLRAEIVATNVANATTPGYVRRSVTLSETVLGGRSTGVTSDGITRAPDSQIKAQRRELTSDLAQASVLSSTWSSISAQIGNSSSGAGLFKTYADFETALARSVGAPESVSAAANLLQAARGITQELNSLSDMIVTQRAEADREIAEGVNVVNDAIKQIESLNARLAGMNRTTSEAASLMDERQRVLDTVSEYLPIQTVDRDSGAIDVLTTQGVFLLAGKARPISFTPSADFAADVSIGGGQLSGISVDDANLTPGATSFAAVSGGLFGALFTLRDSDLPRLGEQLDAIARDLIGRLSDDSIDPSKTPGEPGLFVDPDAAAGPGLAGRISLNAAVDPDQGGLISRLRDGVGATTVGPLGNNTVLKGIYDAFTAINSVNDGDFIGSFSSSELVAQLTSIVGQNRIQHEAVMASTQTQHTILIEAEQNLTGVDVDVQMQELMLVEQAYAANARVIEVASQMIKLLMEL
jgi:flagellar hook-associated protein 1 FlgK